MNDLWEKCLEALSQKIRSKKQFDTWIKSLDGIVSSDLTSISIYVQNRFKMDYIVKNYKSDIEDVIKSLCSSIKTIEYKIIPENRKPENAEKPPKEAKPKSEAAAPKAKNKDVNTPSELLAVCSNAERILPNEIVRSALFNARNRNKPRVYMRSVEIAVIGGGRIIYRGEELRQDDATVFMHIVHIAKNMPIGDLVEFTPYSICKAIGWGSSSRDYQRLRESLSRMQATALEVRSQRIDGVWGGESMSMIPYFKWKEGDETLAKYQVKLAPQLVELFGNVHYTRTDWEQRLALPDGLATWLHTYFASHRNPHPVHIDTIMQGAGMSVIKKEMTRILKKALAQLAEIGFLASWEITGDFVHVVRA